MSLPPLQYLQSRDGVRIAYTSLGEGPPIVFASNIFGDVQHYALPTHHVRGVTDELIARGWRVILHDVRGMGSSDRDASDLSLAARVVDLEAIVDQLNLSRFALVGTDIGAATAIAYAATHPDQITNLALMSPWSSGAKMFSLPHLRTVKAAMMHATDDWALFTNVLGSVANAFDDSEYGRQIADLVQRSTTPQGLAAYYRATEVIDLTRELSSVRAPTIVLHEPTFPFGSFDLCKEVTARLQNAHMVTVEDQSIAGTKHGTYASLIDQFLRSGFVDDAPRSPRPRTHTSNDNSPLSPREIEVLRRLANGMTNKEIAAALGLAVPTVERHLVNIYSKLGAKRRADAVAYAVRNGLDVLAS